MQVPLALTDTELYIGFSMSGTLQRFSAISDRRFLWAVIILLFFWCMIQAMNRRNNARFQVVGDSAGRLALDSKTGQARRTSDGALLDTAMKSLPTCREIYKAY